jgi:hypothetical protein
VVRQCLSFPTPSVRYYSSHQGDQDWSVGPSYSLGPIEDIVGGDVDQSKSMCIREGREVGRDSDVDLLVSVCEGFTAQISTSLPERLSPGPRRLSARSYEHSPSSWAHRFRDIWASFGSASNQSSLAQAHNESQLGSVSYNAIQIRSKAERKRHKTLTVHIMSLEEPGDGLKVHEVQLDISWIYVRTCEGKRSNYKESALVDPECVIVRRQMYR